MKWKKEMTWRLVHLTANIVTGLFPVLTYEVILHIFQFDVYDFWCVCGLFSAILHTFIYLEQCVYKSLLLSFRNSKRQNAFWY